MNQPFSRREMLKVGILGTGFSLSQYLRAQAAGAANSAATQERSAIFIFLEGAPSHQDTFDLKPDAPVEVRGEFKPISTNVSGVQICEHLPMLAKRAEKYAIVRGITHNVADHGLAKKYLLTGNKVSQTVSYPEYGSVVSHEFPSATELPTYVSIDESFVGPGLSWFPIQPADRRQTETRGALFVTGCHAGRWLDGREIQIAKTVIG